MAAQDFEALKLKAISVLESVFSYNEQLGVFKSLVRGNITEVNIEILEKNLVSIVLEGKLIIDAIDKSLIIIRECVKREAVNSDETFYGDFDFALKVEQTENAENGEIGAVDEKLFVPPDFDQDGDDPGSNIEDRYA